MCEGNTSTFSSTPGGPLVTRARPIKLLKRSNGADASPLPQGVPPPSLAEPSSHSGALAPAQSHVQHSPLSSSQSFGGDDDFFVVVPETFGSVGRYVSATELEAYCAAHPGALVRSPGTWPPKDIPPPSPVFQVGAVAPISQKEKFLISLLPPTLHVLTPKEGGVFWLPGAGGQERRHL